MLTARESCGVSWEAIMTAKLIDLRQARNAASNNLPDLQVHLAQLIGEPFRFTGQ